MELILADLDVVSKRIAKLEKLIKSGDKKLKNELEFLLKVKDILEKEKFAINLDIENDDEKKILKNLNLLTAKPVIYVANVSENEISGNKYSKEVEKYAKENHSECLVICGKIEAELNELSKEEREEFLKDMGITERSLNRLIKKGYEILDLITFYTIISNEVRGWTVKKGTKAPEAGGKIHKDFEKGFIRAEIIKFDDFVKTGSESKCRELGLIKIEGKNYIVEDGDIIHFRFNV